MRIAMFYHSLVSDWNHGNAHFLRGVVSELLARGHDVTVWEPEGNWSLENLLREHGKAPLESFAAHYPGLSSRFYSLESLNLDEALEGADLVLVHEWNEPELVARIGRHHRQLPRYGLLFHDTHHRAVTDPAEMARYELGDYDGVLAFGRVLRDLYLERGWARRAWVWHEAADARRFHPIEGIVRERDLVWIGNWGDDERTSELHEYLIEPARRLGLSAIVHGVRYPEEGRRALAQAGITYAGWLPNFMAPEVFARHRVTVHVPRRPYATQLPGIPTIRVFEALACGIPLVSAWWDDAEGLFTPGEDYLLALDGDAMTRQLRMLLADPAVATELINHGRATIERRHTCAHRVDELLTLCREELGLETAAAPPVSPATPPNLHAPAPHQPRSS